MLTGSNILDIQTNSMTIDLSEDLDDS